MKKAQRRSSHPDAPSLVAPSPNLQRRLNAQLATLRQSNVLGANSLNFRGNKSVGLNDGLIKPGHYYPLGTPARVVKAGAADRAPLRGVVRVIVVLAQFKDKKFAASRSKKHFEDLLFSTGALPHGSVRDYYREVTHGLIDIQGQVVGPYVLPKKLSEYAHGNYGTGGASPNARTMARDAAEAADPEVNFAPYDNDGNGFVDAFIVIHAGPGAEETGRTEDIWSHKWVLEGGEYDADGTKIYGYLTVPEDAGIGVCCHELGHLLFGWPDLYDTDSSSSGLGDWCLMAGGSWNGQGEIPAHPSAWCKIQQDWISVVAPKTNSTVSIADIKSGRTAYRLWKSGAGSSEYFLAENRQRTQYDQALPGDGLLVYHIDETVSENSDENHPKVNLMQADGRKELTLGVNRGDAGDPFPGSSHNTIFNATSDPNSKSYGGIDTCVGVTDIGPSGAVITAKLSVKCVAAVLKKRVKTVKTKTRSKKSMAAKAPTTKAPTTKGGRAPSRSRHA